MQSGFESNNRARALGYNPKIDPGMSSVYAKKYWKANHKYTNSFDPNEESSFIINIDANNLHGGIMEIYSLPRKVLVEKNFATNTDD